MKKLLEKANFIGRPFADQLMDEQKTFTRCNLELEQDPVFQQFLADHHLETKRSSMVVFGLENFMYWYGVLVSDEVKCPQGLMRFALPPAEVALVESDAAGLASLNQPLNQVLPAFLAKISSNGIQVYENPGDSQTPYIVQDLNLATKKLAQMLYLDASEVN
ncbi:hypothetical protein [Lactobacillus xylocopicola]|uniref:Uncharacterized protein n=1 Tax=Lactobacillus xylocopicola TaxID=2976676 RepID=A0ABN6SIQ5_9LACO|nr:hypothetical protein [Lactobacillus xylocopicola]BDR60205.1 hypothetical protein KIM322_04660 [Lactobacillus xylocopicola]